MNEQDSNFFQIPPRWYVDEYDQVCYESKCMFMGECFNIRNIFHVDTVRFEGPQMYKFRVYLSWYDHSEKVLDFPFVQKATALKASRELARAYTETGEYSLEQYKKESALTKTIENKSEGLRRPQQKDN